MIPDNSGSVVESKRLAENPPDTPANAAASPAIGCLPNDKNITAPKGINTTYPASEAIFDITPAKTTIAVKNLLGVAVTTFFIVALISPLPSATPIPRRATKTVPKGANPVKFLTIEEKIYLIPSAFNKDLIVKVVSLITFSFLSNAS